MERLLILLFLGLTLFGLANVSASADELDIFEEFSQEFENKIDIEIDSLDFIRPESGVGNAGTFKFKKFQIQNPKVNVFMGNEQNIFDSNIFIQGNKVGIKGPFTRFAYQLDEENEQYLHSFKWAKVHSTKLFMDKDEINFSGVFYQIRKPESELKLENFIWNCDRHPDYLENDANGFLAGCLNSAEIAPFEDERFIDIDFTFIGEKEKLEDRIEFKSNIKNVRVGSNRVQGESETSTITFGNGVHLVSSQMTANCGKPESLIDINTENLLIPCLNDFQMNSEIFGIYFKENSEEYYNFEKPEVTITKDLIQLNNKMFKYESPANKLSLRNVEMVSSKALDFNELEYDTYLKSLYNSTTFQPSKGHKSVEMDFSIINLEPKRDDTEYFNIKSEIESFKASNSNIKIKASKTLLNQDNDYFYYLNDSEIDCEKEINIVNFNSDKVLADCKYNGTYKFRDILVDNKKDPKKTKYFLKPEYLKIKNGYLSLLANGFQIVDEKENLTLLNTSIKCKKGYEKDLFELLDILEDCFQESSAYISRIVSEKNKKRDDTKVIYELYKKMLNGKVANPIDLIRTKDAFVRDVVIKIKDNWLKIDLDIKFMGADLQVNTEGSIFLDRENEIVTIDLKKAKLPLTKSKKILMYFLKKNMANETIVFEEGKILIKL